MNTGEKKKLGENFSKEELSKIFRIAHINEDSWKLLDEFSAKYSANEEDVIQLKKTLLNQNKHAIEYKKDLTFIDYTIFSSLIASILGGLVVSYFTIELTIPSRNVIILGVISLIFFFALLFYYSHKRGEYMKAGIATDMLLEGTLRKNI